MEQGITPLVELHPRFQEPGVKVLSCKLGQGRIGGSWKNNLYINTALCSVGEGLYRLVVRDKIGVGHMKRVLRESDGGHIHNESKPIGLSRGTAQHPHQSMSLFLQVREIVPFGEFRALLFLPCVKKQFLELGHGRAFDLNIRITPWHLCFFFSPSGKAARINLTDVDAPGKSDSAVDDQYFTVIRFGEAPFSAGLKWIYRVKFDNLYSPIAQALKEFSGSSVAAYTVVDEVHLNPFRLLLQQQIGKFATRAILNIFHGKGFDTDMVCGILYRLEHGSIGGQPSMSRVTLFPFVNGLSLTDSITVL